MYKKCTFFLCFLLPFALQAYSAKAQRARDVLENLDELIEKALEAYQVVPGIAVGVVVDGEVVYLKGFGYRDLEKELPVTKDTVFAIGSCTKAFTAFAVGNLVDEGLLSWDDKVVDVLPDFRLMDQYATQNITVRDLLTHRSGMPRHDYMWYTSHLTRSETMKRIRYLKPSYDIRERYQYNSLMYLSAACAMENLTGHTWEEILTDRILNPLDMKNTTFNIQDMKKNTKNYALPYVDKLDKVKQIPFGNFEPVAPGASLNSSADDLTRWLILNLSDGVYKNQALISPATLQEILSPQIIVPGAPESNETLIYAYGIGWAIVSYRGHYYVSHDGGVDGFTSLVGFLPNDGIGLVILTNQNLCSICRYLSFEIMDKILELPHHGWLEEGVASFRKSKEMAKENKVKEDLLRKKGTSPSHLLEEYAGEYEHPGYGKITITARDGKLYATFNGMTLTLDHWHYDVFNISEESQDLLVSLEGTKFSFQNNLNGEIDILTIPFEPTTDDIEFKRKIALEHTDQAYLRQFTGFYEIYGYTVEIALRNNTLQAIIPGQPVYELVANGDNEFVVKSLTGYLVRFKLSSESQVEEVIIVAPYGAFTAQPKT